MCVVYRVVLYIFFGIIQIRLYTIYICAFDLGIWVEVEACLLEKSNTRPSIARVSKSALTTRTPHDDADDVIISAQ